MKAPLRWYLASTASFLIPGGIQMVLFPWLVAVLLHEPAARVGIAQMAGSLPALFLILFGGVIGDRFDQRRILIVLHLAATLPPLILALLIGIDQLSYQLLIGYALVSGIVGAFSQPARDALLSRVAGDRIQRTVTLMIGLQFGVQILGIGMGSLADGIGPVTLILIQATAMGAGAAAVMRIRVDAFVRPPTRQHALKEIRDGIALVFSSPRMWPVMMLNLAIGVFFAGTFMVLIPLHIRDVYDGGSQQIGLAYMLHMTGTVVVTFVLLARGGVSRPGRALLISLGLGSLLFVPIVFGVSLAVFYLLIFIWGLGAGVAMSMARTIVQESAPASHRARIMSVYSLGMMGGMPFGSLLMGYVIGAFGPHLAALVPVLGMAVAVAWIAAKSDLWTLVPHPEAVQV